MPGIYPVVVTAKVIEEPLSAGRLTDGHTTQRTGMSVRAVNVARPVLVAVQLQNAKPKEYLWHASDSWGVFTINLFTGLHNSLGRTRFASSKQANDIKLFCVEVKSFDSRRSQKLK
jgi:hypothetical protein